MEKQRQPVASPQRPTAVVIFELASFEVGFLLRNLVAALLLACNLTLFSQILIDLGHNPRPSSGRTDLRTGRAFLT